MWTNSRYEKFNWTIHSMVRGLSTAVALSMVCACGSSEGQPTVADPDAVPSQILNLTDWKITLPVEAPDDDRPVEIFQPELARYQSEFFRVDHATSAVAFTANVGGIPQPGSDYARTELRVMANGGRDEAAWSSDEGKHTMTIREAIIATPEERPSLVAGQIHDDEEYIVLIRLDGHRLYAKADDRSIGELDEDYQLGTVFTVRLEAEAGRIRIFYNDELKVDYEKDCSTCYFKAGVYLQTNAEWGDADDAVGRVDVYDLTVEHQ